MDLPFAGVLADMESEGVAIDVPYLKDMQDELGGQLSTLESQVEELAGQKFNLNAPQQLAKVLFEDLRLPVGKRTKTGYSTDADTLEALRDKHDIIPAILEHRQLSKLKSPYADALPQLVDPLSGRGHTSFGQASTATGRLSSSNPNRMNIPIRTELGQRIRRAFKAGRPDHATVSAHYSQIELRIAAHLSGEPKRMAINFPMQSLAADIIKIAMVRLQREIEADQIEGRMLLQVHDELLFEVPRSEVDQFAEKVPRIMTGAYELETGIEVEMRVGPNWADVKKLAVVRAAAPHSPR